MNGSLGRPHFQTTPPLYEFATLIYKIFQPSSPKFFNNF